jgi:hypothetical protein
VEVGDPYGRATGVSRRVVGGEEAVSRSLQDAQK